MARANTVHVVRTVVPLWFVGSGRIRQAWYYFPEITRLHQPSCDRRARPLAFVLGESVAIIAIQRHGDAAPSGLDLARNLFSGILLRMLPILFRMRLSVLLIWTLLLTGHPVPSITAEITPSTEWIMERIEDRMRSADLTECLANCCPCIRSGTSQKWVSPGAIKACAANLPAAILKQLPVNSEHVFYEYRMTTCGEQAANSETLGTVGIRLLAFPQPSHPVPSRGFRGSFCSAHFAARVASRGGSC